MLDVMELTLQGALLETYRRETSMADRKRAWEPGKVVSLYIVKYANRFKIGHTGDAWATKRFRDVRTFIPDLEQCGGPWDIRQQWEGDIRDIVEQNIPGIRRMTRRRSGKAKLVKTEVFEIVEGDPDNTIRRVHDVVQKQVDAYKSQHGLRSQENDE